MSDTIITSKEHWDGVNYETCLTIDDTDDSFTVHMSVGENPDYLFQEHYFIPADSISEFSGKIDAIKFSSKTEEIISRIKTIINEDWDEYQLKKH